MIEFEFNSEDVPAPDQFGRSRELIAQLPAPLDTYTDQTVGFRLRQHEVRLDSLRVWTMAVQSMTLHRTGRLIRRSDPETYNLILLQRGTIGRTWDRDDEATYGAHDLHANDSSQPYVLRMHGTHGLVACMGVALPKKLLPLPRGATDRLVGRRLSGCAGIGALLGGFLDQLTSGTGAFLPSDGSRLATVLVDLTAALFAHALEADDALLPEARQRSLVLRIRAFIQQNLSDPHLSPSMIAAAHHISTSYLHRLFQGAGVTIAAWIRDQRLERARRDLTDPAQATTSIGDIAARWGFSHAAAFSRIFRAAYGMPPKDYRHRVLHATV